MAAWSDQALQADLAALCQPDAARPFASREDAFNRLAPYHVFADEAEACPTGADALREEEQSAAAVRAAMAKESALRARLEADGDPARLRAVALEHLIDGILTQQDQEEPQRASALPAAAAAGGAAAVAYLGLRPQASFPLVGAATQSTGVPQLAGSWSNLSSSLSALARPPTAAAPSPMPGGQAAGGWLPVQAQPRPPAAASAAPSPAAVSAAPSASAAASEALPSPTSSSQGGWVTVQPAPAPARPAAPSPSASGQSGPSVQQ